MYAFTSLLGADNFSCLKDPKNLSSKTNVKWLIILLAWDYYIVVGCQDHTAIECG